MNPFQLLRQDGPPLTPEEEAYLCRELSDAYHVDEMSAASASVRRIAEKVKARLQLADDDVTPSSQAES